MVEKVLKTINRQQIKHYKPLTLAILNITKALKLPYHPPKTKTISAQSDQYGQKPTNHKKLHLNEIRIAYTRDVSPEECLENTVRNEKNR
jgi:hypothetical protein